jgi:predicted transcriptional regulator of viral defense system
MATRRSCQPTADTEIQLAAAFRPQPGSERTDKELERWSKSKSQHGVLTLPQLEAFGLSGRAVRHRLAAGRLRRLHRGVYAIGVPTAESRWIAALLACGEGAVLSHRSAAALWGLHDDDRAIVHVTLPSRATRVRPHIKLHSGAFDDRDRAVERGIPCTAMSRTLLDLATQVDRRALRRAIDRAEELRLFDLTALDELLRRNTGRRGARALATALAEYTGPTVTRSETEEALLAIVDSAGLPAPAVNGWIALRAGDTALTSSGVPSD